MIWGLRIIYHTVGEAVFHCPACGGDRRCRRLAGRRFITVFFIPVIPLTKAGEVVQCATCRTRYPVDVLRLPTAAQMQTALPAGMRAAATAMLRSGPPSPLARQNALAAIRGAGAAGYSEADLTADAGLSHDAIVGALGQVARQLTPDAREWFLAEVVRIGLADGPLSDNERNTAQDIAAQLGMTPAQARGVITMTEEGAAA